MIVKECPCTCENSIVEEYQDQECSMTPWGTPYGITFFTSAWIVKNLGNITS